MKLGVLTLMMLPSAAISDEWVRLLTDEAVFEAIADRTIEYDAYTFQIFEAGGGTQYFTERMSEGRWAARAGQYCSTWPPSDTWACYDIQVNGERVRFIASDRSVSEGFYRE